MTAESAARWALPLPPGTNNLYFNVPGAGRRKTPRYAAWIREAQTAIMVAGSRPRFECPVSLRITLPAACRIDTDAIKALPDLLVSMGILPDDSAKYVDEIVICHSRSLAPRECEMVVRVL